MEPRRFRRHQFHEAAALTAAREVAPALRQRRECVLEQVVHVLDVLHEVDKLKPEDLQRVLQHSLVISLTFSD